RAVSGTLPVAAVAFVPVGRVLAVAAAVRTVAAHGGATGYRGRAVSGRLAVAGTVLATGALPGRAGFVVPADGGRVVAVAGDRRLAVAAAARSSSVTAL